MFRGTCESLVHESTGTAAVAGIGSLDTVTPTVGARQIAAIDSECRTHNIHRRREAVRNVFVSCTSSLVFPSSERPVSSTAVILVYIGVECLHGIMTSCKTKIRQLMLEALVCVLRPHVLSRAPFVPLFASDPALQGIQY